MTPYSSEKIEEIMRAIGARTNFDRPQQERMAFAIRQHLPDIAAMVVQLADEEKANAPKLEGPPPACPLPSRIRAVQATVWDNWLKGDKTGNRYGLTLEVWDDTQQTIALNNYTFKCQAALMPAMMLKSHVRKNMRGKDRTYPVSDTYLNTLDGLVKSLEKDAFIGLINTNIKYNGDAYKRGLCYHDDQFIIVRGDPATGKLDKATLYLGGEKIDINFFSGQPYGKKPFAKGVVLQSRVDLCDFFPLWSTNSLGGDE